MPRATYGPKVKDRTVHLLRTLLQCANTELDAPCTSQIVTSWHDTNRQEVKLIVQSNLRTMLEACSLQGAQHKFTKAKVRESLRRMQDFLEILEDYRVHQRGTEVWHFALTLPSRNTEAAVSAIKQRWDDVREEQIQVSDEVTVRPSFVLQTGLLPGAPFQVPPLPHYFVDRPEHRQILKNHLLQDTPHQPGTLVVSAIYGLGGIGKSVLASALAHDLEVQSRFSDGVLWATLGQEPDILSFLSSWIQELGDHSYKPTTQAAAVAHLRTLLYGKRVLLVVDDVWDPIHAEPFRIGGSGCCVLVTTREARIQGALRYDLDVMTPEESLALFSKALQQELVQTEIQEALALARAVEYLPLALELAAAQIEEGASWEELLTALKQEIADLEILDIHSYGFSGHTSRQRNLSLLASFNLSLKRLLPEQLERFAWLGVIPEDVTLSESMAATLWDMTPQQARTMLRFLKSRALLLSSGRQQQDQRLGYRMHDLMHDLARRLLTGDPEPTNSGQLPGLGLGLSEAHRQFLDRYRQRLKDDLWHTVPADGYIHAYLIWHLEQAGLAEEVHQLLQETTVEGSNGWYEALQTLGKVAGFVADIARAWQLAVGLYKESPANSIGLQLRYALIKASLNSLVQNFPPELVASLVTNGLWQPAQGLTHAQQSPDPRYALKVLNRLVPLIPESLFPEALHVTRNLSDKDCRALALVQMALRIPDKQEEALRAAYAISDKYNRALALGRLATGWPDIWPNVVTTIRTARTEKDIAWILREFANDFPEVLLDEVFQIAQEITEIYSRSIALGTLAVRKQEANPFKLHELIQPVRDIPESYGKAYALGVLALSFPKLWAEVMQTIQSIEHESSRGRILDNLAKYLPDESLPEAVKVAESIQHETRRSIALGALASRRPELCKKAIEATDFIRDEYWQIHALSKLAEHSSSLWLMVMEVGKSFQYPYERAIAMAQLIRKKPELRSEALDTARSIHDVFDRAMAFKTLAYWGIKQWPEALAAAQSVEHYFNKAQLFYELAEVMPEAWNHALEATDDLWYESQKVIFLYTYAFKIPESSLPKALEVTNTIEEDIKRLLALSKLSARMPEIRAEVIELFNKVDFSDEHKDYYQILILGALAFQDKATWEEVLDFTASSRNEEGKSQALYLLAPMIPVGKLEQALAVCLQMQSAFYKAYVLRGLLPRLDLTSLSWDAWCELLQTLAFLQRSWLLELIPDLSESIMHFGGQEALVETARSVVEVCKQW